jgi:hypothetical protein
MRFMNLTGDYDFLQVLAAKGGTKPNMVIFLGRNNLL